jgi:hypothetical protein
MSSEAEAKSNKISMTLPTAVLAALDEQGAPLDMTGGEFLKFQVIMALQHPDGIHLKLERPKPKVDPAQGELFKQD